MYNIRIINGIVKQHDFNDPIDIDLYELRLLHPSEGDYAKWRRPKSSDVPDHSQEEFFDYLED